MGVLAADSDSTILGAGAEVIGIVSFVLAVLVVALVIRWLWPRRPGR